MKNSKVTFLREIRGSRIYSSNQQVEINHAKKKYVFNNFYLKNILLGSNGRQRHMPDITELEF